MDVHESHSESEDDLPSNNSASSKPKDELVNENIHCLSSSDVLAEHLRNTEFFIKEDICIFMNTSANQVLENDDDVTEAVIEQAQELQVQSTPIYYSADYQFLHLDLCGCLFNQETLVLKAFMGDDCYGTLLSRIKKEENLDNLVKNTGLQIMIFPNNVTERLCCYLFYLMSVHSDFNLVYKSASYLISQQYVPAFSDIFNVLCNWGASPWEMFRTTPSSYQGLHPALLHNNPSTPKQVEEFNVILVLRYLIIILKTKMPVSYADLLGPMLQFSVNGKTYFSSIKLTVCEIVRCIANMKDCKHSLENLHQMNLSLRNQFFMCHKSLTCTVLQLPLAYATLQQFLGESIIKYTTNVDLQDVFNLVNTNRDNIIREDLNFTSCILKLTNLLLGNSESVLGERNAFEYLKKWIDLLRYFALNIPESCCLSEDVRMMEQFAQMIYKERINN